MTFQNLQFSSQNFSAKFSKMPGVETDKNLSTSLSFQTLICCLIATTLAAEDTRSKKPVDNRGKRNLEYTIIHNYPTSSNHRTERRISTGPQLQRYSPFFPGPRPYTQYQKGRPSHSLPPPPYAVQMEPLIHYSQRDPLYDTNNLSLIADNNNELNKSEDLQTDNNQISESVYGPPKHYVEQPVYIKDPEPIIEIIIKESNVSLPPLHAPPAAPTPRKKEQVQVFYVKYKKNPNGHGKDSIIYEKPVPAISPVIPDEPEEEPPQSYYGKSELVTAAPPPSTTLRTIIKPDSETYHGPSGIKVTFGKEGFDYDKRSPKKADDAKEESAPEPTISHPQARQFPISEVNLRRQPVLPPGFHSGLRFSPETIRFPQPYRTLPPQLQGRPPQIKSISPQFAKQYLSSQPKYQPQQKLVPQFQAPLQPKPQFSQPLPNLQEYYFHTPRQPVPYQPFTQIRPQSQPLPSPPPSPPPQFEFPTHTHFPIHQQPPLVQQQNIFNQQLAQRLQKQKLEQLQQQQYEQQQQQQQQFENQHNSEALRQQQQLQHQFRFQQPQLESSQQFREPSPTPQYQFLQKPRPSEAAPQNIQFQYQQQFQNQQQQQQQQQFNNLQQQQQQQQILPPGGELIPSLSKYEQHISIPADPSRQPTIQSQPEEQTLSQEDFRKQIQQQFNQEAVRNAQKGHYIVQNSPSIEQSAEPAQKSRDNYFIKSTQPSYQTSPRPTSPRTVYASSTTTTEKPTTQKVETSTQSKKDEKALSVQLPDEVPDELRQQLLSSGILNNADISVLDYDKVGDIPLSALPPDQLANFYTAGGAQQLSGSAPIPSYAEKDGTPVGVQTENAEDDQDVEASESHEVKVRPPVEMKVVHYDPQTEQGKNIQEHYVKDTATQVRPVVLNDQTYNKYLPLKVNGAEFPIPDVPELEGKNITSVVVLAPVDYSVKRQRRVRDTQVLAEEIQFVTGNLKDLLENPTRENYRKFLENENKTASEKQSVILLVAG